MNVKPNMFNIKNLKMTIYDFNEVNDILPKHIHDEQSTHITIVARGQFLVKYNDKEEIAKSGDVYDWNVGDPHEFISLEPKSRIINILKN